jgi:hypothetical protein
MLLAIYVYKRSEFKSLISAQEIESEKIEEISEDKNEKIFTEIAVN